MKRKVVNEKVIRAMAIGISAMLATATPMTAMAAEGVDDPEGGNPNEAGQTTNSEAGVCDAAQKAADVAQEAADAAQKSAGTVKTDVETNVSAGEGKDLAKEVIDAAKKTEDTTVEEGSSIADAKTDIENADTQLGVAEAKDELSDSALGTATDSATNAGTIAEDLNTAMDEANAKVDEQFDDIQNATTIAGANVAYDKLASTASAAQEKFNTKLKEYNDAKDAYDAAVADVKKYEEAYNKAIADAKTNAEAAKAELEAAQKNAAALEAAVNVAKDAVDASAVNAMKIAKAEDTAQTDGGLNWRNEDTLFAAIMTNYYLPEKLGIKGATVTRVQGKDNNEYNYFKVEYNDAAGKPQVKYYNYKMDNGSKDDIVIFEKRDVEVDYENASVNNPDEYVGKNGTVSVEDVEKGINDGTIVNVNGTKVVKNDKTDSETLVSNSNITGTSTKDVTINESTKQETWQYDAETGELVKTVTADVTTVTYTGATFTSDKSYDTDEKRDAAAEAKKKELEKTTGKDATINETENTTYTYIASGTYIPTFTKTVNVKDEEVESGRSDLLSHADSDAEAVDIVKKEQENALRNDDDLYCINIKSNLSVTGHTDDKWYDDSDYLVSGTVTATYAKVTKKTVDMSTFGSLLGDIKALFNGDASTDDKLKADVMKAIGADGGIFVGASWFDGKYNKATIKYVAGVKVTTEEKQTAQDAKNAVQGTALEQAKANGATGVYNVKTADAEKIAHTTYSYTVDYLQKTSKNTVNKAVATETYGNAVGLTGQIIQNKNYKDGIILLNQRNDKDYRAFVDDAKAITGKYDRLLDEAQLANADVQAAQKQVEALQKAIDDLKGKSNNVDALTNLEKKLATAEDNLKKAEGVLEKIKDKLEDAGVELEDVIERLTPAPGTPGTPGAPATEDGAPGEGPATVVTTTTTTTAATNLAIAGAGNAGGANAGNAGNAGDNANAGAGGIVNIDDEETALAASVDDVDDTANVVEIGDEETPLAASVDNETMSWWWLLLIALLGATGYEMYRKHQQKKEALAETDDVQ